MYVLGTSLGGSINGRHLLLSVTTRSRIPPNNPDMHKDRTHSGRVAISYEGRKITRTRNKLQSSTGTLQEMTPPVPCRARAGGLRSFM